MLHSFVRSVTQFGLLVSFMAAMVTAGVARAGSDAAERGGSLDNPMDPPNLLSGIQQRRTEKEALFLESPLGWLHDAADEWEQAVYEASSLKLGFTFTHLFQGMTNVLPGEDHGGMASDLDFVGTWELVDRGEPTQGEFFFAFEGRWDYGTTGPQDLAVDSLGSLLGTANTFAAYTPTFILRQLFWRQGSPNAGGSYRIGKFSTDALLSTSAHIAAPTTFLPTASSGPFAIALPDSGLGAVGAWYINDRVTLVGLVSDANGNRYDFGDIGAGDFFKAAELHAKIAPRTPKAGYSKLTLWHTDGTKDGQPSNGQTGPEGWGYFIKHEQELTDDGRAIGILRYGKAFEDSAFYNAQASAHYLLYNPPDPFKLQKDLLGLAVNWVDAHIGVRDEYDAEIFYRFPFFPGLDTTLSYQLVINPALDLGVDHSSVFSLRLRTVF